MDFASEFRSKDVQRDSTDGDCNDGDDQ